MATIENKVFRSLLDNYLIETEADGEYVLTNAEDDLFYFRYYVNQDVIEGGYELTEGQVEILANIMYDYHIDNQLEDVDDSFTIDHYSETGTNPAMFI